MPERREFDKAFKVETVRLITEQGRTIASVARELGVWDTIVGRWVKQYRADSPNAFPGKGHLKPDDEEVRRLKRRNAELEEEVAILKKPWPSSQGPPSKIRVHPYEAVPIAKGNAGDEPELQDEILQLVW